jgi:ethanolamine ammonia-lyase small subunit
MTAEEEPKVALTAPDPWRQLRAFTPARIALGRAGGSLPTRAHLSFQLDHARARDAVHDALDPAAVTQALLQTGSDSVIVRSAARDRLCFLQRPDLGRRLDVDSRRLLEQTLAPSDSFDVAFVVADGLSARAIHRHAVPLLSQLCPRLLSEGWRLAPVAVAEQGRVALGDEIGALMGAAMVIMLIGERPGLSSPDSLGAYLTWQPRIGRTDAERNCISNIRPEGLTYETAANRLHYLMREARRRRVSGVALKDETGALNE